MVAVIPPIVQAPPPTLEERQAAFADILTGLEARCDQIDAMLRETRERCREGRDKLAAYRDRQRKVSTRWR
jgi:hypothetical protein